MPYCFLLSFVSCAWKLAGACLREPCQTPRERGWCYTGATGHEASSGPAFQPKAGQARWPSGAEPETLLEEVGAEVSAHGTAASHHPGAGVVLSLDKVFRCNSKHKTYSRTKQEICFSQERWLPEEADGGDSSA